MSVATKCRRPVAALKNREANADPMDCTLQPSVGVLKTKRAHGWEPNMGTPMIEVLFIVSLVAPPLAVLAGVVMLLMPTRSEHVPARQPAERVRA